MSRHSTASFTYILVIPPGTLADVSPFQGFSHSTFGLPPILHALAGWPAGLYQLLTDRKRLLWGRLKGTMPLQIEILQVDALTDSCLQLFTVLISTESTEESTERFARNVPYPVLHVTAGNHPGVPHYAAVTRDMLYAHCRRVIRFVKEKGGDVVTPPLPDHLPPWKVETGPQKDYAHNVTVPNEMAARGLGLRGRSASCPIKQFTTHPDTDPDVVNAPYRRIILDSARAIRKLRRKLSGRDDLFGAVDLILTAPSVYAQLSGRELASAAKTADIEPADLRRLFDQLLKQRYYPQLMMDGGDMPGVISSFRARMIVSMRKWELDLYTAVVGIRAAGYFCPVVRLPPAVNLMRGRLANFGGSARAGGHRRRNKLGALAREIGNDLEKSVGKEFIKFIAKAEANVKIVSDAPLELLPIDGFPLCLRYSTSRVTTTPGNLLASQMLTSRVELVEPSDLLKVLVIRSFEEGDRIKRHLQTMVDRYLERSRAAGLDISWVDVRTVDQFVEALNGFEGRILVYDGHGSYSAEKGHGTLRIGGDDVDVWTLRRRARVPPIAVLSACDTHAIDGTHASTANGLLTLGAITVLGTLAPVNALHSGAFVGRLMFRLAEYVRILPALGVLPLRWSEIVGGLIKMNYLTDLLFALKQEGVDLDEQAWRDVTQAATGWINALDKGWLEKALEMVGDLTGRAPDDIKSMAHDVAYFTETLKYVQLGNPEEIVIVDPGWRQQAETLRTPAARRN